MCVASTLAEQNIAFMRACSHVMKMVMLTSLMVMRASTLAEDEGREGGREGGRE